MKEFLSSINPTLMETIAIAFVLLISTSALAQCKAASAIQANATCVLKFQ